MEETKLPRKNVVDWEAMDIFLFTNGEEGSPPRKYHLKTEELDWWDATLSYLAQSHYGSLHSVLELYTTDGTKVENPMQLSNGAAYVAVVPPNPFISAGYDKYLLKATRSRDKRYKNTISSNESVLTEDNKLNEDIANTEAETNEIPNISTPRDKNITPKVPVKQNSLINRRPSVKRNITTPVKRNDFKSGPLENTKTRGRNDSKTVASPLLSRKNVNYPSKVTTKNEKEERKSLEFSPKAIKEERNSIGINNTIKISNKSAPVHELLENTSKSNIINETKEINISPTTQFLYPSQQTAITLLTPKITGDREKTSAPIVFLNQEQEFVSSGNIQPTNHQGSSININMYAEKETAGLVSNNDDDAIIKFKKKEFETIIDRIVEKILSQKMPNTSTPFAFENVQKIKSFKPVHPNASETITANDDRDRIITIAHNGEVVNLKLNIEVANVEPASAVQVKSTRATSNVFMAEKSSQANSDFILHASTTNETNQILQGFSEESTCHTLRNDDSLHCDFENCDNNLNAVLVQCLCCNNKFVQENNPDVQYVIIIPSKTRGNSIRCKCNLIQSSKRLQCGICKDSQETSMPPILKDACCKECKIPTDTNHKKKETSMPPILKDACCKECKIPTDTNDEIKESETYKKEEAIAKFESIISRQHSTISMTQASLQRSELSINKYVSKTDRTTNFSKDKLFQGNQTETIVAVRRKSKDNFLCVVDAATQTDWCNILLEARPLQDGHYTFHFPPLSVLRYYT